MTRFQRIASLLLAAVVLATAASCIDCRNPLSDEQTSKIDERLLGTWRDDDQTLYKIERSAGTKNTLDLGWTPADKSKPGRALLFTTTVAGKSYISYKVLDVKERKRRKGDYDIYQYRLLNDSTLEVRGMDFGAVRKAIAAKKLGGEIDKDDTPVITDSAQGIARYLEANADACYPGGADTALTLKRVK